MLNPPCCLLNNAFIHFPEQANPGHGSLHIKAFLIKPGKTPVPLPICFPGLSHEPKVNRLPKYVAIPPPPRFWTRRVLNTRNEYSIIIFSWQLVN
jgi:hypothetical protein